MSMLACNRGDDGDTSLFDGSRVSKADDRVHVLGLLDGANVALGGFLAAIEREEQHVANVLWIVDIYVLHACFLIGALPLAQWWHSLLCFFVANLASKVWVDARVAAYQTRTRALRDELRYAQARLIDAGSVIATPNSEHVGRVHFDAGALPRLERTLRALDAQLPALRQFLLPCAAIEAHRARVAVRDAERAVVVFAQQDGAEAEAVLRYLNRLSKFLFVAARYFAALLEQNDVPYQKARCADAHDKKAA